MLDIETGLAQASRTRVELRDPNANYNKFTISDFAATNSSAWLAIFAAVDLRNLQDLIVGQPEFFTALRQNGERASAVRLEGLLALASCCRSTAPYLHHAAEQENFAFYGTKLRGQPEPEPRWQRAARVIDGSIGEALGQLYVEKYFPPAARARMNELIGNLRDVFRDRLKKLDWMSDATAPKALAKFDRFTQKIGHPDKFRDYSKMKLRRDDFLGNIQRAAIFETRRDNGARRQSGGQNRVAHDAANRQRLLQSAPERDCFPRRNSSAAVFRREADDAVNYGAIGVVIGHEITHGYDDKGRQDDADGNLNDWWTEKDAKEFDARAQKVVDQYSSYEALPGLQSERQAHAR